VQLGAGDAEQPQHRVQHRRRIGRRPIQVVPARVDRDLRSSGRPLPEQPARGVHREGGLADTRHAVDRDQSARRLLEDPRKLPRRHRASPCGLSATAL